ncbi:MAG: LacI family DNA-binding transcriptional regulator [Chloroflexia bacterium]
MTVNITKIKREKSESARQVTLADIARESHVSLSTVSLVLREKPGFPDETRRRVLDVAKALGYRSRSEADPSSARHRGTKLHTLGLLVKSIAGQPPNANPFYSHVLAGIEDACRRRHVNLLYSTLPVDEHNIVVDTPRLLRDEIADGLLLIGVFVDNTLDSLLKDLELPVLLVDAYTVCGEYDAVLSDNLRGAYGAVQHLVNRGHRHIGLIGTGADAYPSIRERRMGYAQALGDNGITERYYADCPPDAQAAAEATAALLAKHPRITAIFGCNDEVAIAAMRRAQAMGRSVPRDLSVIGFDDIDMASVVSPALTTMRVDRVGMGRMAVQLLGYRVEFPDSERVTSVLSPRLIERQSVVSPAE